MPFNTQKNLLKIIQQAQLELGLAQTTVVTSATDQTTMQMYGYANQEINELFQRHNWTVLQKEYNLAVNPPVSTTGTTSLNSATITGIPDTSALAANYFMVAGSNIPAAARIQSVDSPTQITMTMEATSAVVGTPLTFSQDTYPEPTDFDHFINDTWWDRTNKWSLLGPDSPVIDQWHRSGIVTFGPRRHFRQLGYLPNTYRIWPPPAELTSPLQLVFEYVSNQTVFVNGVFNANPPSTSYQFANDGDVPILDSRAIINGVKWRFWRQKGFDWTSMRSDYDDYVNRLVARDGGKSKLQMATTYQSVLINSFQVQDGNYPGFTGSNTN